MSVRYQLAFNESAGPTLAEFSGGPSATLTANGFITAGKTGNGVNNVTDGASGATVDLSTLSTGAWTGMTVMCWCKFAGLGTDWMAGFDAGGADPVFGMGLKNTGAADAAGYIQTNSGSLELQAPHGTTSGNWMHLAVTWSASDPNVRLFVNGTQVDSGGRSGATIRADVVSTYLCGVSPWGGASPDAAIDDFRIFDNAESEAAIATWSNTPVAAEAPVVDIGADSWCVVDGTFGRIATEDDKGSPITAREWKVMSGPADSGNVVGTDVVNIWAPSVTGSYVIRYTATNGIGASFDELNLEVGAAIEGPQNSLMKR